MYLNLNCAAIGHHQLSLRRLIHLAQTHGFGGIDPPLDEIAEMEPPCQARNMIDDAGLRWGSIDLSLNYRTDDRTAKQGLHRLRTRAKLAQQIGCDRFTTWLLPYHDELDYPQNFDAHVRRLQPACRILADHGIRLGIEFVGPQTLREGHRYPFIHTMNGALELAHCIQTGNVGLLLDSFHWYTTQSTAQDIETELNNQKVVLVHVNDAIAGRSPQQQIDRERALPGDTGVINLNTFFSALEHIGYSGPVTAEPMMPELGKMATDEAVARTAITMRHLPLG